MKFIIEAIGVKSWGGIELALNLLSNFAGYRNHDFIVLLPDLPQFASLERSFRKVLRFRPDLGLLKRHFILNRDVPRICRNEGANALLCLGNFAPRRPPCPVVLLLQNAWNVYDEPTAEKRLTLRERLTVAYGRRFYRRIPPHTGVVVQTPVMKQRLTSYHGLANRKIEVIPSAPPRPDHYGHTMRRTATKSSPVFTFLCLSEYRPHKNLEVLVDAVRILRRASMRPFRCLLTLSTGVHPGAQELLASIRREQMESLLVNVGPVPRSELSKVYRQADACLLPTLLETVGFAYDEAMQFGLPILTSDRDFSRCRCDNAAIYFDPLRPESVAAAMWNVMTNSSLRAKLVANGRDRLNRAARWEDIAARFLAALERAASYNDPLVQRAFTLPSSIGWQRRSCHPPSYRSSRYRMEDTPRDGISGR